MQQRIYRFNRCAVHVASRELVVDGAVRQVEPKAFDLLVYLIEHGSRVVTKEELLTRVWKNKFVSVGVIARAVMKVRRAIGDCGEEPTLVGTAPRIGYRFIGEVDVSPGADASAAPDSMASPQTPDAVALALLPFENRTGQPQFDWVELGLMSMVAKALSADSRLSLPLISSLLMTLGSVRADASLEERVGVVRRQLGVHQVVHVAIGREGDNYCLGYSVMPPGASGHLRGPELTDLGTRLAAALATATFADSPATTSPRSLVPAPA